MLSALLLIASAAEGTLYFKKDGWDVYRNEDNCAVITQYDLDTSLWFSYDHALARTSVVIVKPSLKSVAQGKKYNLKLRFLKSSGLDEGWGNVAVSGTTIGDKPSLMFSLKGDEALTDFATSSIIALLRDDLLIVSLKLNGSAEAVAKLRECSRKVWLVNPSDPLAGAELD